MLKKISSKYLIPLLVVFLICLLVFTFYKTENLKTERQQTIELSEQQATNINALQNELKISKQNAEQLATEIEKVKAGKVQPVTYVTVKAPTVNQAATDISDKIKNKDSTLPPVMLEKSDKTIVVPQQVKNKDQVDEWQVGVYKVNNYRNWEWSAGYGTHGKDHYIPIELQRNFDKNQAVSYEHHLGGKEKGWEVKYTVKTDKLLFIF